MIYEVMIVEKPTKKEAEEGAVEKIIRKPEMVAAQSEKSAVIQTIMGLNGTEVDREKMEILVRPFN